MVRGRERLPHSTNTPQWRVGPKKQIVNIQVLQGGEGGRTSLFGSGDAAQVNVFFSVTKIG